jgi:hypothetical protein
MSTNPKRSIELEAFGSALLHHFPLKDRIERLLGLGIIFWEDPLRATMKRIRALFTQERRFEKSVLLVIQVALLGLVIVAIANAAWWLVALCAVCSVINGGLIGQRLHKNRADVFSQPPIGTADEPEKAFPAQLDITYAGLTNLIGPLVDELGDKDVADRVYHHATTIAQAFYRPKWLSFVRSHWSDIFFPRPGPTASSPVKVLDTDTRCKIYLGACGRSAVKAGARLTKRELAGEYFTEATYEDAAAQEVERIYWGEFDQSVGRMVHLLGATPRPRDTLTRPLPRRSFWAYGFAVAGSTRNESFPNG